MARVVESVVPDYSEVLHWEKHITKNMDGAMRFSELSKKLGRPAPVPSIFINGELVFDSIPSEDDLNTVLKKFILCG